MCSGLRLHTGRPTEDKASREARADTERKRIASMAPKIEPIQRRVKMTQARNRRRRVGVE